MEEGDIYIRIYMAFTGYEQTEEKIEWNIMIVYQASNLISGKNVSLIVYVHVCVHACMHDVLKLVYM